MSADRSGTAASAVLSAEQLDSGFEHFLTKLSAVSILGEDDRQALADLCSDVRHVSALRDIVRDRSIPDHVHIILGGWAARYKILRDGSRQITAILLPGDLCDLHVGILEQMDHGILALTDTRVAFVPHQVMEDLPIGRPVLARALWRATLIDKAVLRAWIVNLGRRQAQERLANLFCELHVRLANVGLVEEGMFKLPLTQEVLADALGLTPVHVNRSLMKLREAGLIALDQGELRIPDIDRLSELASFDPSYLHRQKLRVV